MKHVMIYTDGACRGNPGPGGWGVLLSCNGAQKELPMAAAKLGAQIVDEHASSLNEIFVAHAGAVNLSQT